jgi:hypothetical protein
VIADNATRWNLVYLIFERALKLRDVIDLMIKRSIKKKQNSLSHKDELLNDDWLILSRTAEILKLFYILVVRMQGRASRGGRGLLWKVLFTMEFLMGILESRAVEYGKDFNESKHRADPEILKCMDINLLDYKFLLIILKMAGINLIIIIILLTILLYILFPFFYIKLTNGDIL